MILIPQYSVDILHKTQHKLNTCTCTIHHCTALIVFVPGMILHEFFTSKEFGLVVIYVAAYPTFLLSYIGPQVVVLRFWIFYYQTQLNRIYENSSWRMAIDASNQVNNNWFVKNNKYLGNKQLLFNICCIIGTIGFGLLILITELPNVFGESQFRGDIVVFTIYGSCLLIGGYLVIKLKYNTLDDNLGIRQEIFFILKYVPWQWFLYYWFHEY